MKYNSQTADSFTTTEAFSRQLKRSFEMMEDLNPKERNIICPTIIRASGEVIELPLTYNSRTNAGALWQAGIMGNASGAASAQYIALSSNASFSPLYTDTTVSSEISTVGLGRAIAAYGSYVAPVSLNASASYTLTKTFNATGTISVYGAGVLTASSGGTLFVEGTMSTASLNNGDSLAISWVFSI